MRLSIPNAFSSAVFIRRRRRTFLFLATDGARFYSLAKSDRDQKRARVRLETFIISSLYAVHVLRLVKIALTLSTVEGLALTRQSSQKMSK